MAMSQRCVCSKNLSLFPLLCEVQSHTHTKKGQKKRRKKDDTKHHAHFFVVLVFSFSILSSSSSLFFLSLSLSLFRLGFFDIFDV